MLCNKIARIHTKSNICDLAVKNTRYTNSISEVDFAIVVTNYNKSQILFKKNNGIFYTVIEKKYDKLGKLPCLKSFTYSKTIQRRIRPFSQYLGNYEQKAVYTAEIDILSTHKEPSMGKVIKHIQENFNQYKKYLRFRNNTKNREVFLSVIKKGGKTFKFLIMKSGNLVQIRFITPNNQTIITGNTYIGGVINLHTIVPELFRNSMEDQYYIVNFNPDDYDIILKSYKS